MSSQIAGFAPATRVVSRKLGPTSGSRSDSSASAAAASWTSTFAITCGRWLTVAISRSCASASIACGRAPRSATVRCSRSYWRPPERSVGVRYQRAPSKRSARALSTPDVSAPASGWPPMNRSRAAPSGSAAISAALGRAHVGDHGVLGPLASTASATSAGQRGDGRRAEDDVGFGDRLGDRLRGRDRAPPTSSARSRCRRRDRSRRPRRPAAAARRARPSRRSGRRREQLCARRQPIRRRPRAPI